MKLALLAPTYLPARRANTIQGMKMAQALAGLGHDVRVAVPEPPSAPPRPAWEALARHYGLAARFPVTWLPAHPRLKSWDYALRALRWAAAWGAEHVYTRLPQAAALASLWGTPTTLETHDLPQGNLGPLLFRAFLKGTGARQLVVITRTLKDALAQRFPAPPEETRGPRVILAPDGVDLARYEALPGPPEARRLLALPEAFTAGYTGHLYPGRGATLILALAARLPDAHFLLVGGEPDDVARVRAQAAAQGLANVTLTGFVPNAELPRYQAACEALLMPYQTRVAASSGGDIAPFLSPMKLFEYLACGRAILSSDLPVLREVLTPANALLLPPADGEAWAAALRALQAAPETQASLAAQARRDASRYTWEARAKTIFSSSHL